MIGTRTRFATFFANFARSGRWASPQCWGRARKFAVIAEELGNELAMIEAPDDVAAEHAALVRGLARARTDLEELAGSDGLSWSKRYMAVGDLELAVAELDALRARGYDFSI